MHEIVSKTESCPLCSAAAGLFHEDHVRGFFRCPCCRLIFADPRRRPSREAEKRHYDCHQNDPRDAGYRRFLSRLFEPLNARLPPGSRGLDFGAGPGPTLSLMFSEAGHDVLIYDPFYAPDRSVLKRQYDFVTASEVVEHLHHPGRDLDLLWSLVRCGGWLGIMTRRAGDAAAFADWHYKRDPTHVSFFSLETFAWLAERWRAEWLVAGDDVVLFQRSTRPGTQRLSEKVVGQVFNLPVLVCFQ